MNLVYYQDKSIEEVAASLGAIWSPCSDPTLGAVVRLAAQSEPDGWVAMVLAIVQPRSCDADLGARLRLAVGRMF